MSDSWADGTLVGFDLETTGTDPFTAMPVSYALVQMAEGKIVKSRAEFVNPGIPIPDGAFQVHHISDGMVESSMSVEDFAASLGPVFDRFDEAGVPLVGSNLAYDLTIMARILGAPYRGPVIDLLVLDKAADKFRKGKRTLSAMCDVYGVTHRGAHDAANDVIASLECVRALAAKFPKVAAYDLGTLHDRQVGWRREQQRSLSEYFERTGKTPIPRGEWEWPVQEAPAG